MARLWVLMNSLTLTHLTHVMKGRAVVEAAIQAAKVNFPPPKTVTLRPLRTGTPTPSDDQDATQRLSTSFDLPPRTPSPEMPQTPRHAPASVSRIQKSSDTLIDISRPNTVPRRRNHKINDVLSSLRPTYGSVSPSPTLVRSRSPDGLSSASTTASTRHMLPFLTGDCNLQRSDVRMVSPNTADPTMSMTRKKAVYQQDPYSHLSTLQRDIMLTIQNASSALGDEEKGVSIGVLVQMIPKRRTSLEPTQLKWVRLLSARMMPNHTVAVTL